MWSLALAAELSARDDLRDESGKAPVRFQTGGHLIQERPVGNQFTAAQRVAEQLRAQGPMKGRFLSSQVMVQSIQSGDFRAVVQRAAGLDHLAVAIFVSPSPDGIEVLERET